MRHWQPMRERDPVVWVRALLAKFDIKSFCHIIKKWLQECIFPFYTYESPSRHIQYIYIDSWFTWSWWCSLRMTCRCGSYSSTVSQTSSFISISPLAAVKSLRHTLEMESSMEMALIIANEGISIWFPNNYLLLNEILFISAGTLWPYSSLDANAMAIFLPVVFQDVGMQIRSNQCLENILNHRWWFIMEEDSFRFMHQSAWACQMADFYKIKSNWLAWHPTNHLQPWVSHVTCVIPLSFCSVCTHKPGDIWKSSN